MNTDTDTSTTTKRGRLLTGWSDDADPVVSWLWNILLTGVYVSSERHLKCDVDSPSCKHCQQFGIECDRNLNIRFRHFPHLNQKVEKAFPGYKEWLPASGNVQFYDETPVIASLYNKHSTLSVYISQHATGDQGHQDSVVWNSGEGFDRMTEIRPRTAQPVQARVNDFHASEGNVSNWVSDVGTSTNSPFYASPNVTSHPEISTIMESPISFGSHEHVENLLTEVDAQLVQLSDREVVLMRNFIENMALWADVTDLERHFEIDVPCRALRVPLLRFAIFAFSSRHLHGNSGFDSSEAVQYHNQCLQHLIPAISGPEADITEETLATVAILRQYEEMEVEDHRFHLTGTIRILNSKGSFACSGGLGEAAAWLCLRQDIYISLVSQKPLRTDLERFVESAAFRRDDDLAWANRMVFLLAKTLGCAFGADPSLGNTATLRDVSNEVENWKLTRPATFNPIRFIPRGRDRGHRLPEIWMLAPFHVVGLQYYHIAKIVLVVSNPSTTSPSYNDLRRARQTEKFVRTNLLIILGLAISNDKAENALFTARHTLSVWGGVLRHPLDQDAAVSFLRRMERRTGWSMTSLISTLQEQWQEDSDHG